MTHELLQTLEKDIAERDALKARIADLEQRPTKGFCANHKHLADSPVCVWCLEQQQESLVDAAEKRIAALELEKTATTDELEVTLSDEEAAHAGTLRMLSMATARITELKAIVERLRPVAKFWQHHSCWFVEISHRSIPGYLAIGTSDSLRFESREDAESAFNRWLVDNGYAVQESSETAVDKPVGSECVRDTNRDGDCEQCSHRGGCAAIGGPFIRCVDCGVTKPNAEMCGSQPICKACY